MMLHSTLLLSVSLYILIQQSTLTHSFCMGTTVLTKLEIIESKLDKILLNMLPKTCEVPEIKEVYKTDCIDNKRDPSTVIATPKKTIDIINRPHYILFTKNNDVFITGYGDGHVYRYDLAGNFQDKFKVPHSPTMMDLRDNILYISDHISSVYTKDITNDSPVTKILSLNAPPVGIKISDDGKKLYIGLDAGIIDVYDEELEKIAEMKMNSGRPRKILIDVDGYINVAGMSSEIYVFNKTYGLVRVDNYPGVGAIDGFVINCDGSKIFADRRGKVTFVDEHGEIEKSINGYNSPADVGIAPDDARTLWVAETHANKVHLY